MAMVGVMWCHQERAVMEQRSVVVIQKVGRRYLGQQQAIIQRQNKEKAACRYSEWLCHMTAATVIQRIYRHTLAMRIFHVRSVASLTH